MRKCYSAASHCARNTARDRIWDFCMLPLNHWVPTVGFVPWTSVWPSVGAGWRWACAGAGGPRWCLSCHRHSYQLQWRSASAMWWHSWFRKASVKIQDICSIVLLLMKSLYKGQERINAIDKLSPLCFKMKLKLSIDFSLIYTYIYTCNYALVFLYM